MLGNRSGLSGFRSVVFGGGHGDDGEGDDLGGVDSLLGLGNCGSGGSGVGGGVFLLVARLGGLLRGGGVGLFRAGGVLLFRLAGLVLLWLLLGLRNLRINWRRRISLLSRRVNYVFSLRRGLSRYASSFVNRLCDRNSDRDVGGILATALVAVLDGRGESGGILLGGWYAGGLVIDDSVGCGDGGVASGADVNIGCGVGLCDVGIFLGLCWDCRRSRGVGYLGG